MDAGIDSLGNFCVAMMFQHTCSVSDASSNLISTHSKQHPGLVELRNAIASSLDASLPATIALDYPTLNALSNAVEDVLMPSETGRSNTHHGSEKVMMASTPMKSCCIDIQIHHDAQNVKIIIIIRVMAILQNNLTCNRLHGQFMLARVCLKQNLQKGNKFHHRFGSLVHLHVSLVPRHRV